MLQNHDWLELTLRLERGQYINKVELKAQLLYLLSKALYQVVDLFYLARGELLSLFAPEHCIF